MVLPSPTMFGAKNPPKLPIELMSAIPPAAALPLSSAAGRHQNTGIENVERACEHAGGGRKIARHEHRPRDTCILEPIERRE